MAKKGPMPTYATVDDYIAHQPEQVQHILVALRAIILETAPEAIEMTNSKVPSYTLVPDGKKDVQIMMAGYAKYVSFYPFPTTMAAFSDKLRSYKQGKGSVQFPLTKPLPRDLIVEMVRYRLRELERGDAP